MGVCHVVIGVYDNRPSHPTHAVDRNPGHSSASATESYLYDLTCRRERSQPQQLPRQCAFFFLQRMLSLCVPAAWRSVRVCVWAHLWQTHPCRCTPMPTVQQLDARKSDLLSRWWLLHPCCVLLIEAQQKQKKNISASWLQGSALLCYTDIITSLKNSHRLAFSLLFCVMHPLCTPMTHNHTFS